MLHVSLSLTQTVLTYFNMKSPANPIFYNNACTACSQKMSLPTMLSQGPVIYGHVPNMLVKRDFRRTAMFSRLDPDFPTSFVRKRVKLTEQNVWLSSSSSGARSGTDIGDHASPNISVIRQLQKI